MVWLNFKNNSTAVEAVENCEKLCIVRVSVLFIIICLKNTISLLNSIKSKRRFHEKKDLQSDLQGCTDININVLVYVQ